MNREIKFRAFNTRTKEMLAVATIFLLENTVFVTDKMKPIGDNVFWWQLSHTDLMQYTGLLDSTGKPVYEGDIVKFTPTEDQQLKGALIEIAEIVWLDHRMLGWGMKSKNGKFLLVDPHRFHIKIEILGNVFENPELLEGKE